MTTLLSISVPFMLRVLVALSCLSLSSCSKPSPAAVTLGTFLEQVAKGDRSTTNLASGSRLEEGFKGELLEGIVEIFPRPNIGVTDWAKTKVVKDQVLPGGEHRIDMLLDVCLRAEEQNHCNRPSTYAFTALVVNEEGAWRVSSASCAEQNMVR